LGEFGFQSENTFLWFVSEITEFSSNILKREERKGREIERSGSSWERGEEGKIAEKRGCRLRREEREKRRVEEKEGKIRMVWVGWGKTGVQI
jgi:hypothetical protein